MFFDVFCELCKRHGKSPNKAAEEIGLSNSITTKWKKTGATPTGETLAKIADYFGVSTDYLLSHLDNDRIPADIRSYKTENAPTLTEKDRRNGIANNMNVLRIAGRDGSFEERVLTDDQMVTVKAFLNLLPDASDDL